MESFAVTLAHELCHLWWVLPEPESDSKVPEEYRWAGMTDAAYNILGVHNAREFKPASFLLC